MAIYGYIRVSKNEQNIDRQIDGLKAYESIPPKNIYIDKKTGVNFAREQYQKLKKKIKPGDVLVIHKLDRLGRNKDATKNELRYFTENKIRVKILNIPTTLVDYPAGQEWVADMVNNILIEVYATLAQAEHDNISQNTKESLASAKARGIVLGRPKIDKAKADLIIKMWQDGFKKAQIMETLNISHSSVVKYINAYRHKQKELEESEL